jgi:hypothetical protein
MMDIAPSAHRHDVAVGDMLYAVAHQITEIVDQRKPYFAMLICSARNGQLLEIGVLDPDGEPVIIHAMPLRRNWRRYVRED